MGEHLDWYRTAICQPEGHRHGEKGELTCLLLKLAELSPRRPREA
jgi:hypothetical protein